MELADRLSKSRYVKGLRCPRALYLAVHHYDLATPPTPAQRARFDVGHSVGELAQQRYPGGVLIAEDHFHHREAVESTRRAIDVGANAIFEAAFVHDNVKIRADVLRRLDEDTGGWELIEVKSTGRYDPAKHLPDVGVQLHVLLGSGIDVRRVSLMHLDKTYVYPGGPYDPHALLTATDVTSDAFDYISEVPIHLAEMMALLAQPGVPETPADVSCEKPYVCEFREWCTREAPEPDLEGDLVTDPAVMSRLDELPFPLYFVDFETINPGLPLFPGTSPFQVVKVQWSVHTMHADDRLEHAEYLAQSATVDPAPEFIGALLDALGTHGTFVHYSPYERTHLVDIAVRHPAWRQPLIDRIPGFFDPLARKLADCGTSYAELRRPREGGLLAFDLGMRIVRDGCSHPIFGPRGWSIKDAVRVIAPDLPTYAGLAVRDGEEAMSATVEMLSPQTSRDRASQLRHDLLEYCKLDTFAMVEIFRRLRTTEARRV